MKRINNITGRLTIVVILTFCAIYTSWAGTDSGNAVMPEVKNHRLDNGVTILRINDDLPKTEIYVSISYGRLYEDMGNAGMSQVIANLLMVSGSKKYPGDSAIRSIEAVGGEINVHPGWENISIDIKVLSRDAGLAFDILSDMLTNPIFTDKGVQDSGRFIYQKYMRSLDDPASRGMEKLREIIFEGKGYGAGITTGSIKSITRASVGDIWDRYVTGGNIIVSVSSSIDDESLLSMCKKSFGVVKPGKREYYTVDTEKILAGIPAKSANIYLIPAELDQATILTGVPAAAISYEGNYAIAVMDYILGGGSFGSRLMTQIRERRGLAYSVYSYVVNRYTTGFFYSFAQTRNEEVGNVLGLMNENIRLMYEQPVLEEELSWAIQSIINSYVFTFSKISQILDNYFAIEYYGLDKNYFTGYTSRISSVTPEQIMSESRKLFGNGLVTVIVGKRELEKDLSKFGKVIIVENTASQSK